MSSRSQCQASEGCVMGGGGGAVGTAKSGTTEVRQIMPRHLEVRSHHSVCRCQRSWHAHSPCARAVCSAQMPWRAPILPEIAAPNQRRPGNNNHQSRSALVVPQSGNFVPRIVVSKNWCQSLSAPNFAIFNFAHTRGGGRAVRDPDPPSPLPPRPPNVFEPVFPQFEIWAKILTLKVPKITS